MKRAGLYLLATVLVGAIPLLAWGFPTRPLAALGNFSFSGNTETLSQAMNIGTALTDAITLTNTTAAADGAQQNSPAITLCGRGWKTDATAASRSSCWSLQSRPIQGAANPTPELFVTEATNGTPADVLSIYSIGTSTRIRSRTGALTLYEQGQTNSIEIASNGLFLGSATDVNVYGNTIPGTDSTYPLGGASKRWSYLAASDVVGDLPACSATTRGAMTVVQSGAGVGDILKVCMKGTADTYAYRDAFTAP